MKKWEIIDVQLEKPLARLDLPPDAAGAYLVFWWHSIPLGHLMLASGEFPLFEADLASRASSSIAPAVARYLGHGRPKHAYGETTPPILPLASLTRLNHPLQRLPQLEKKEESTLPVSVIVCTRKRPESLRICLQSIKALQPKPLETIVVDNAPADTATASVVAEFPGVYYVPEPRPGLSRARNAGIRQARGDIVAFTDDDVSVHPLWIAGVVEALKDTTVSGMTGLVLPAQLENEAQLYFETRHSFNCGYQRICFNDAFFQKYLPKGGSPWVIGAGANMAFRRSVFHRIGLFDERLGAGSSGCSEDSELWYRMLATGMTIVYEPRAVVRHAHRTNQQDLRHQMREYMRGHVTALFIQYQRHGHTGNLRRLFITLPLYYTRRWLTVGLRRNFAILTAESSGFLRGFFTFARLLRMPPFGMQPKPKG